MSDPVQDGWWLGAKLADLQTFIGKVICTSTEFILCPRRAFSLDLCLMNDYLVLPETEREIESMLTPEPLPVRRVGMNS